MPADPRADAVAAGALSSALARVGYEEEAILDLLGDESYSATLAEVPVIARRLDESALSSVVRVLFLGLTAARADVEAALGARGVEALAATGLAELGAEIEPLARILPIGDLLLAADGYSRGVDDPPDYVAPYTPTSRLLDNLTPRRRVRRALDVGTGSGVQALRAARHAREVVATDVNERALAYARLNAALNGRENIELRTGSLLEPVAGERFDPACAERVLHVRARRRQSQEEHADDGAERALVQPPGEHGHLRERGGVRLVAEEIEDRLLLVAPARQRRRQGAGRHGVGSGVGGHRGMMPRRPLGNPREPQ